MKDFCIFTPTHIYTQFCYACFEETNLFQYNHCIREQLEHNMNFLLLLHWFCPYVTLGKHRKQRPAELRP